MWSCSKEIGSLLCLCQAAGTEGVASEGYRCSEGGHSEEAGEAGESSAIPQFTAEGSTHAAIPTIMTADSAHVECVCTCNSHPVPL